MSNATADTKIDDLCDDVFQRDLAIDRLNREATQTATALQDTNKELQVTRDVVAIRDGRIADLEKIRDNCASDVADLVAEINRLNAELARKQPIIASQLARIEELENNIQNRLCDISALEDTISDRDTARKSVKFNVTHMLQSALAVLNGL